MRALARALYRLVLLFYPREFRREYGGPMKATFDDLGRRKGWIRTLFLESRDAVRTGIPLRCSRWQLRRPRPVETTQGIGRDLRQAFRSLRRSPGFTSVAVLSLALGIGANAAVLSLVDAVALRPMNVREPDRLVAIYATRAGEPFPLNFSYPNYRDLTEAREIFSDVIGFRGAPMSFDSGGETPELLWGEMVTENYFTGLGVPIAAGRAFSDLDAAEPVAVLSHDLWQRRFGGSPGAVGRTIRINGHELTVVGVAAQGFSGAKFLGFTPELWVPIRLHAVVAPDSEGRLDQRSGGWLSVRARLAPGITASGAEAALASLGARLEAEHPDVNRDWRLHLMPAPRKVEPVFAFQIGGLLPIAAGLLLAIVGIVLLIACANVASLQIARALGRRRELAIRLSLGATRSRLVRQLVLESVLLAAGGLALGLWLAHTLLAAALKLGPALDFSIDLGATIDARVVAVTAALSVVAGLLAGLLPALEASRRDVSRGLTDGGAALRAKAGRRLIVVPQLALSLVALVCAGLLVGSFRNVSSASPGFATRGVLLASVNVELQRYSEERGKAFYRALVERLERVPGVRRASLAFPLPLDASTDAIRVFPADRKDPDEEGTFVFTSAVSEGYFEALSTPIVAGRGFRAADEASERLVAVANETLAERFWPDTVAVGRRLVLGTDGPEAEVVGVARDGKYLSLGEDPRPYLFLPLSQHYRTPITILVSASIPPRRLEPDLRQEVASADPTLALYGLKTMEEFLDRSVAPSRALALSVSAFALLALALTTIGVYGLMSFVVSQKRHEIGIRMALGAGRAQVLRLCLTEAGHTIALGIALGLAVAWMLVRGMSGLLFGISATSPAAYAVVAAGLALIAVAGSYLPARRAARLDPLKTLKHD